MICSIAFTKTGMKHTIGYLEVFIKSNPAVSSSKDGAPECAVLAHELAVTHTVVKAIINLKMIDSN